MTATTTDRPSWLQWRRGGAGASDVPAILGISPWASPFSVWANKLDLLPDDDENEAMEFGRWAELMIGPWFAERSGLQVAGEQMQCQHPEHTWQRCTIDGLVFGADQDELAIDHALGLMQIKTTKPGPRWAELPAWILAQEQWEMHVTGFDHVWLPVLHGRRLEVYELDRDQADIDMIVERVGDWWVNHVVAQIPPEVDGSEATAAAIAAIYPDTIKGKAIDLDDVAGAFRMLADAKRDKRDAEAREDAAAAVIRWAMADAAEGRVRGVKACTLNAQTRKSTCTHCGATDESAPFKVLRPTKEFA